MFGFSPFVVSAVALGLALVTNAAANICIKAASRRTEAVVGAPLWAQLLDWRFLVGLALFGVALGGYSLAMRRFELSVAYPVMTGGGLLVVTMASVVAFGEHVSLLRALGLVAILLGVILVSRSAA